MKTKLNPSNNPTNSKIVEGSGITNTGKPSGQPKGNVFSIQTGKPEGIMAEIKPRRSRAEEKKLRQITAEHFGYEVVEGKGGKKEVVDAFDERHPMHSKNIRKGGTTASDMPAPKADEIF